MTEAQMIAAGWATEVDFDPDFQLYLKDCKEREIPPLSYEGWERLTEEYGKILARMDTLHPQSPDWMTLTTRANQIEIFLGY